MGKLIDADKLLIEISRCRAAGKEVFPVDDIIELISKTGSKMETVESTQIVRCKDCKNWNFGDCYRIELTLPSDFCSYGERIDNPEGGNNKMILKEVHSKEFES